MTTIKRIEQKHNQKRKSRIIIWVIVALVVLLTIRAQASTKTEIDVQQYTILTVSDGDTLWEMAEDVNRLYYQNQLDLHDLVKHIREVNHLNSVVIREGQTLKVATNFSEY